MPPRHPPPVFFAPVKADSGKASPSPVLGCVLGGFPRSPHSLLCPRAPCAWLWPMPCPAELPSELSAPALGVGMPARGLWRGKAQAGSRQECAGLVRIPASSETACTSRCPELAALGRERAWVSGRAVGAPGRLLVAQGKDQTHKQVRSI